MVEFLDTTGISAALTDLIKNSNEKLFLISPYLKIADRLKLHIKERDSRKIDIRVVFRTDKLNAEEMSFLQELTSVKVLSCDNLHAKCYLNENIALLTSMNLYLHSQQNNWEMGVKIDKTADSDLYKKIYDEVMLIIQSSQQTPFSIKKIEKETSVSSKNIPTSNKSFNASPINGNGFCIRCGGDLKINPEKPLCFNCYKSWEEYSNPLYQENFCHICGKESATTYEKPVCYTCYKKVNK
ncbi:MAG: phospholipase D family protein [Candidatus Methanoperedens sp.]|nr:phospholipase D family protein [Candidatus Methanoperedens sp.]MCZ7406134.1 phospholipase D family protein [Candidatus Methanoperedens sp.]